MTPKAHEQNHPDSLDEPEAVFERREVLAALDRFIVKHYGERCPEVQGGCSCCTVWAVRDALNAAIFDE